MTDSCDDAAPTRSWRGVVVHVGLRVLLHL
jgi:hypothetical protein